MLNDMCCPVFIRYAKPRLPLPAKEEGPVSYLPVANRALYSAQAPSGSVRS